MLKKAYSLLVERPALRLRLMQTKPGKIIETMMTQPLASIICRPLLESKSNQNNESLLKEIMVYYFQSVGSEGSYSSNPRFIYMGKDKYENEDLIRYGLDQDVWFHVDNLSSAHVYLRLNDGEKWDSIPEELLIGMFFSNVISLP